VGILRGRDYIVGKFLCGRDDAILLGLRSIEGKWLY
jgi:hypothetical protein